MLLDVYEYVPSDKSHLGFRFGLVLDIVPLSQTSGPRVSSVSDVSVPVDGIILCV